MGWRWQGKILFISDWLHEKSPRKCAVERGNQLHHSWLQTMLITLLHLHTHTVVIPGLEPQKFRKRLTISAVFGANLELVQLLPPQRRSLAPNLADDNSFILFQEKREAISETRLSVALLAFSRLRLWFSGAERQLRDRRKTYSSARYL